MLLPFIDQANIYNQFNFEGTMFSGSSSGTSSTNAGDPTTNGNIEPMRNVLAAFLCPSDPNVLYTLKDNLYYSPSTLNTGDGAALTNYEYVTNTDKHSDCEDWAGLALSSRAMFGDNSHCKVRDITDGSSNTIAMIETTRSVSNGDAPAWGFRGHVMIGIRLDTYGINDFVAGSEGTGFLPTWGQPASLHVGGVHALLGDGAVRFLSENIDSNTRVYLSRIADGNVIGEF
tara:strand:+ start:154 stop:843 length:690 start_codon:yes stop_codon:yes gene_type:complete